MTGNQQPEKLIRNEYDLLALWTKVLPAIGVGQRTLTAVVLDEDARPVPTLIPIDDLPAEPDYGMITSYSKLFNRVRLDLLGESLVLLLSRPGSDVASAQDQRWAAALEGISDWPLYLANDRGIELLEVDDLEDTA